MLNNFRKRHQLKAGAGGESSSRVAKPQSAAARREVKLTPKLSFFRSAAARRCDSGCCWRTTSEHAHSEPTRRGKNAGEHRKLQCAPPYNTKNSPAPKLRTSNCRSIWNRESAMTSSDDDEYNVIDERNHGGVSFEPWELPPRCRSATIAGSATTTAATPSSPPPRGERRRLSLPPRRHAICTELERFIIMENGENLRACHKELIIKDYLESLRLVR